MSDEVVFPATMSRKNRLITYAVGWGVFLGVPTLLGVGFAVGFGDPRPLALPLLALALMGLIQGIRTRGFVLGPDGLTIHRVPRPPRIPLEEIERVRADPESPSATLHLWALNGFYGLHGTFWSRELGRFRIYVTNPENLVELVTRDGRRVYVSPDDKEGFLARLEALLAEAPGSVGP
ncbi:MAG TPA: PH domain-containing protein [Longimicrobiales bacterium]|nr:PH domain-containing protein [Longimicrobiales bacterium]